MKLEEDGEITKDFQKNKSSNSLDKQDLTYVHISKMNSSQQSPNFSQRSYNFGVNQFDTKPKVKLDDQLDDTWNVELTLERLTDKNQSINQVSPLLKSNLVHEATISNLRPFHPTTFNNRLYSPYNNSPNITEENEDSPYFK